MNKEQIREAIIYRDDPSRKQHILINPDKLADYLAGLEERIERRIEKRKWSEIKTGL